MSYYEFTHRDRSRTNRRSVSFSELDKIFGTREKSFKYEAPKKFRLNL